MLKRLNINIRTLQSLIFLVVLILIISIISPNFLSLRNMNSIFLSVLFFGIMASGSIFVLLVGGIDLSIGSTAALAGSIMILVTNANGYTAKGTVIGIVLGLVAGALCGLLNGTVAAYFRVPAMIVTLATQNIILGIAQNITHNNTITSIESGLVNWLGTGSVMGQPFPVIFFIVLVIIVHVVLSKTVYGRKVYAVGGNKIASKFTGIDSKKMQLSAYVISGITAAMAGVMLSCFNRQAVATQAKGYEGDVLVALVVGGVSMGGGEGTIPGAMVGIFLMGVINNAMVLVGIDAIYQELIKGVIVIVAVSFDMYVRLGKHEKWVNKLQQRLTKSVSNA